MITETVARGRPIVVGMGAVSTVFDDRYPDLYRCSYRVAFRLLGSREGAADIAQEACARAFSRWPRVSQCNSPEAWVARVAANLAIDAWRRGKTASRLARRLVERPGHVDVERVDLHRALAALPRRQRQVVMLRFVADLSEAAVAAALGCSVGSVKSSASRGLAALRGSLALEVD
jgi:RNA polymerase sigma-70 factor (sigma-E family)